MLLYLTKISLYKSYITPQSMKHNKNKEYLPVFGVRFKLQHRIYPVFETIIHLFQLYKVSTVHCPERTSEVLEVWVMAVR